MPHGTTLGGSSVLLLGIAAFLTVIVSTGVAYGIWALRRRFQRRSAHKHEHILHPPPRLSISDLDTLELGNTFRKGDAYEHESFVLLPHNLASYLPSAPPRAYVSNSSPSTPPGLPPCKVSDSASTPVLVITNTSRTHQSVEVLYGHAETTKSEPQPRSLYQPVSYETEPIIENATTEGDLIGLGLIMKEGADDDSSTQITNPGTEEPSRIRDVAAFTQGSCVDLSTGPTYPAQSSSELPSPPVTPSLPTLVITSASMRRNWSVERRRLEKDRFPSPPNPPTLVLTSPSIHCGLGSDSEERLGLWKDDLLNWSDVFELEDYEKETEALLRGWLVEIPDQLQTPPQTPTFLKTPPSRSSIHPAPVSIDERDSLVLQHHCDEDTPEHAQTEDSDEKPFDYAAFYARLEAFNFTYKRIKVEEPHAAKVQLVDTPAVSLSPSHTAQLDYDGLRARKRTATVSTKSCPTNPTSLTIQVPIPARCAAKHYPLPPRRPGYI